MTNRPHSRVWLRRIGAKGQVTLPLEVRRHLDLSPGDKMSWQISDQGVFLAKVPAESSAQPKAAFQALDDTRAAFAGVEPEKIEREVKAAIKQDRRERSVKAVQKTAGILMSKRPFMGTAEERAAAEQAIADEAIERAER